MGLIVFSEILRIHAITPKCRACLQIIRQANSSFSLLHFRRKSVLLQLVQPSYLITFNLVPRAHVPFGQHQIQEWLKIVTKFSVSNPHRYLNLLSVIVAQSNGLFLISSFIWFNTVSHLSCSVFKSATSLFGASFSRLRFSFISSKELFRCWRF